MASYIEITLLDAETNEAYKIVVSPEDAKRAESDLEFATKLLERARSNRDRSNINKICDYSVLDDNKENDNIKDKEQPNHLPSRSLICYLLKLTKEMSLFWTRTFMLRCHNWRILIHIKLSKRIPLRK
ncbi:uncharacterized protein LOC116844216 isoform X5 [Odontomachus brunneus]|uniref:uncharacterized protein LOC116844216 isoform X5 n=1 Tax=Odontomachus brunneus TaxID=486640 RepID=UPI0013F25BD4|nr:uncharacterized protein LOC116844216 isoform X5 [Odontomachus brunneus]